MNLGTIGLILFLVFAFGLTIKIPIAFAIGIATIAVSFLTGSLTMDTFIQTFFSASDSYTLLSLPFFVLAGDIMLSGGISNKLVDFARSLLGHMHGSLGMITVVTCMIFAAISGSGPATTAAIGGLVIPAMIKENYDKGFAASLTAASGAMGPIIPPSIGFILFGVSAQISISKLFMAGFLPGFLMAIALCIVTYIVCKKKHYGVVQPRANARQRFLAFKDAIWAILVPVIILGGIYGGIFTPTEAAVVSCVYGLIVGLFIYKQIKIRDLPGIFFRSAITSGTILILVPNASALGRLLVMEKIPGALSNLILGMTENPIVILLIINIFLFLVGMVMDLTSAVIILTPLLIAIVEPLGISLTHFGVIMIMNLAMGMCTPPVGVNMFVASGVAKIKVEGMFKWLFFYVGVLFAVLMVVTYVPQMPLFLPEKLM